jgi:hypothetical protein
MSGYSLTGSAAFGKAGAFTAINGIRQLSDRQTQ